MEGVRATFSKRERLVSQKLIDALFSQQTSRSLVAFPLRAVSLVRERQAGDEPLQVLISVPKKRLHHAVDRNRVKRQVREAFRRHKQLLYGVLPADKSLAVAFLWQSDHLVDSAVVTDKMVDLLNRVARRL